MGGLFGGGPSAPQYSMSPEYRKLTLDTLYPELTRYINQGGIKYDTAGMERTAQEDIAGQYGGAYNKVRSLLPYGNPGSMNRANMMLATDQARETSRATTGIRSQSEQGRIQSLMNLLGLAGGMQDPNMTQYHADLQKYGADVQKYGSQAGLFGGIAGLAAIPLLGPAAPAITGILSGGGGSGSGWAKANSGGYDLNTTLRRSIW